MSELQNKIAAYLRRVGNERSCAEISLAIGENPRRVGGALTHMKVSGTVKSRTDDNGIVYSRLVLPVESIEDEALKIISRYAHDDLDDTEPFAARAAIQAEDEPERELPEGIRAGFITQDGKSFLTLEEAVKYKDENSIAIEVGAFVKSLQCGNAVKTEAGLWVRKYLEWKRDHPQ